MTVLISGASVMVVEILGSRILAPTFGTTLHVWSALITVTLAALAIGYAWGGRIADRRPGLGALMAVLALGAGALLIADLATKAVLRVAYGAGMVSGTFLAATLLFLPTLLLLGMVSPMAVRAAADKQHLGQSVGNLYALSTIGSVAGSLIVSLLLIPNLNVHVAIAATAGALALAPLWYLLTKAHWQKAALLLVAAALGIVSTTIAGEQADRDVWYKNEAYPVTARVPSSYGDLVVSDHQGTRFLFLNGVQQGSLRGNVSGALYAFGLERLTSARGMPKSVLVWGLGAGVFARGLAEAGIDVTVIEIDPMSEYVARQYFGLPGSVKVIIGDARTETTKLKGQYDVIVLDAFSGDTPPFHLLTREAFVDLKERLAPNGLVIANIVGSAAGPGSRVVSSVRVTMEQIFGKTEAFAPNRKLYGGDRDTYVSTMFLVSGELPTATPAPFGFPFPEGVRQYVETVLNARVQLTNENAVLLTDAYAPLEAWSDAAVQAMRY
ncbi:MAG: fused MFS/spermidine synthase [Acidobacteriota bacterium]